MRRKLNKIRVKTIKAITWIAIFSFVLSGCCIDSESNIPMIVLGISLAWLVLVSIANRDI